MSKGASGLILLILITIIIFVVIFTTSKLILPNPESIEVKRQTTKQAEDAASKYHQRNIEDQSIDVK